MVIPGTLARLRRRRRSWRRREENNHRSPLWILQWAIGDHAIFARNDFAFALEWVPGDCFAFLRQSPEPSHPLISDLLFFLRGKIFEPIVSAKQQHVSVLILRVHILSLMIES